MTATPHFIAEFFGCRVYQLPPDATFQAPSSSAIMSRHVAPLLSFALFDISPLAATPRPMPTMLMIFAERPTPLRHAWLRRC